MSLLSNGKFYKENALFENMTKSLINKLKGGFRSIKRNLRNIILSATAGLFLYGAQCIPTPPKPDPDPKNNPPTANLYVEPTYGQAPLEVLMQLDGKEDIVEYKIFIDREGTENDETIWQLNPINITRDFYESAIVEGKVTDSSGASDKKIVAVNVYQAGDPIIDLSNVTGTSLNEEQESYITNLPTNDKEGNPITYNNIGLSQNIEYAILENNDSIRIKSNNITKDENYQVSLTFTDNITEKTGTATLDGIINNLIDIQGRLEDCENDGKDAYENPLYTPGVIRVYDASNPDQPLQTDKSDSFGNNLTNSDGSFAFQLNKRVSQAIVQARMEEGEVPKSYVRSVRLDGNKDYQFIEGEDKPVRVVVYPDFDTNGDWNKDLTDYENYREYMRKTNIRTDVYASDYKEEGLHKWDLEGKVAPENALKGIGIFSENPFPENGSSFSTGPGSQYEIIKEKIKASDDIEVLVRGSNLVDLDLDGFPDLDDFILEDYQLEEGTHYEINGSYIDAKSGYILVVPDNNIERTGEAELWYYQNYTTGIINGAVIKIKPSIGYGFEFKRAISHEFKHAFNSPYDINLDGNYTNGPDLLPGLTILRYDTPNTTAGEGKADKKDPYIVNEGTYLPRERLLNILRINWGFADELNP